MTDSIILQVQNLYQLGQADSAIEVLNRAIAQRGDAYEYIYLRAQLALTRDSKDLAAQDLDYLIQHAPPNALYLDDRGVLYQSVGNFMAAAEYHLRATELDPHHDGILLNLAIALTHLGQKAHAIQLYHDVLKLNPSNTRALVNLGVLTNERGAFDEAAEFLFKAQNLGDSSFELYMGLANIYRHRNEKQQAITCYEKALQAQPHHPSALFMLAALRGDKPEAPPPQHVAGLFDSYADYFETSLVDKLNYQSPQQLFELARPYIEKLKGTQASLQSMDLGAGTGLFGKCLRPHVASSVGIDLSAKMLEKAQAQNIYDLVAVADIHDALGVCQDQSLHIISAADVLVYVGDLDRLFALASQKLVENGVFCFTTEALQGDETPPYFLRDTGRYAHDRAYLEDLAKKYHFNIGAFKQDFLRNNKDQPLQGYYVVLGR
jgi:predicted TPR repeat methyltransferase